MARKMIVGFIGLGAMGVPMATRIAEAGRPLVVWDRKTENARPLVEKGAELAGSPEDAAQRADVVISMVTDDAAVRDIAFRPDGVIAGLGEGDIYIDMSTTSPAIALELEVAASRVGASTISAKVSGSVDAAEKGQLVILAGGESDVLNRVRPVLEVLGKDIIHVGGHAKAAVMKLALNVMLGLEMQALAEAYTLALRAGISSEAIAEAVGTSGMASPVVKGKLEQIEKGDFKRRFGLSLLQKDLKLALDEANRTEIPLPATAAANEVAKVGLAGKLGDLDMAALYLTLVKLAGMKTEPGTGRMIEEPVQAI